MLVVLAGTFNVVTLLPPEVVEKTHVLPDALTLKPSEKLEDEVSIESLTGDEDQVLIKPLSDSGPPLSDGCAFCTTQLDEVPVTLPSADDTPVTVTEVLAPLHFT